MHKIVLSALAAAVLATAGVALADVAGGGASGSTATFKATMLPGDETPRPAGAAKAKGAFTATVSGSGSVQTMKWKLTFSGLSGKAVAAHVHKGKAGVAGAVLVPLCGPCRSGQAGTTRIASGAADALERGLAYVNVHTARNKGGEIRGQVRLTGKKADDTAPGAATTPAATTTGGGGDGYYPGY